MLRRTAEVDDDQRRGPQKRPEAINVLINGLPGSWLVDSDEIVLIEMASGNGSYRLQHCISRPVKELRIRVPMVLSCSSVCGRKDVHSALGAFSPKNSVPRKLFNLSRPFPGFSLSLFYARRKKKIWRLANVICTFADFSTCKFWIEFIKQRLFDFHRPKNLLVFVNPYGGRGHGLRIYQRSVEPLFKVCDIRCTAIVTRSPNHAKDVLMGMDLRYYDGIVGVGGDGLLNEIINALVIRTQNEASVNLNDRNAKLRPCRIKMGVIPAGSTNALACTVHGTDDVLTAVVEVALNDNCGVDLCSIHCGDEFFKFACTAVAYGYFGDVLKDSEILRGFGPPRYFISGVKTLLSHSVYHGEVRFIRAKRGLTDTCCKVNCSICRRRVSEENDDYEADDPAAVRRPRPDDGGDGKERQCLNYEIKTVTGDFLHIAGVITPSMCKVAPHGFSPTCHLGDGVMHLLLVSDITRRQNATLLSRMIAGDRTLFTTPYVQLYRSTEFSFTPHLQSSPTAENDEKNHVPASVCLGTWNVDGEVVPQLKSTTYFKVHRQLITVFGRGVES